MPEIPVTALHNYLVKRGLLDYLSYTEQQDGPSSDCTWTVESKINGVVKGTGVAKAKKTAKDEAARQALAALREEEKKGRYVLLRVRPSRRRVFHSPIQKAPSSAFKFGRDVASGLPPYRFDSALRITAKLAKGSPKYTYCLRNVSIPASDALPLCGRNRHCIWLLHFQAADSECAAAVSLARHIDSLGAADELQSGSTGLPCYHT
ncbi:hypothetical protein NMY22_g147 [Coprinellus aureogranulatus]|nr:hypothetical protein NMY22_g147 [Coprinellus aureogranulatus]